MVTINMSLTYLSLPTVYHLSLACKQFLSRSLKLKAAMKVVCFLVDCTNTSAEGLVFTENSFSLPFSQ